MGLHVGTRAIRNEPVGEHNNVLLKRAAAALPDLVAADDDIDAIDAIDAELFPIFSEEAAELLPQLASRMRDWAAQPNDAACPSACMRTLHTLKGGARLAGAMRLGEMAHRLETAIERIAARDDANGADVDALLSRVDALGAAFDQLLGGVLHRWPRRLQRLHRWQRPPRPRRWRHRSR